MLPSYSVFVILAAQIAVFVYLKPIQQIVLHFQYMRLSKQVNLFRCAGLLMVLIAVVHGQVRA